MFPQHMLSPLLITDCSKSSLAAAQIGERKELLSSPYLCCCWVFLTTRFLVQKPKMPLGCFLDPIWG